MANPSKKGDIMGDKGKKDKAKSNKQKENKKVKK